MGRGRERVKFTVNFLMKERVKFRHVSSQRVKVFYWNGEFNITFKWVEGGKGLNLLSI